MKLPSPFSEPINTASIPPPCPLILAPVPAPPGVNFTTPADPTWAHFLYAVTTLLRSATVFRQAPLRRTISTGGDF